MGQVAGKYKVRKQETLAMSLSSGVLGEGRAAVARAIAALSNVASPQIIGAQIDSAAMSTKNVNSSNLVDVLVRDDGGAQDEDGGPRIAWQWRYKDAWRDYPAFLSARIEAEFILGAAMMTLTHSNTEGRTVKIDFSTMQQNDESSGTFRAVRRQDLTTLVASSSKANL